MFVVALGSMAVAIVVVWWAMCLGPVTGGVVVKEVVVNSEVNTDKKLVHSDIVIDQPSIKNLADIQETYLQLNDTYRFHKIAWTGISEVDLGDSKLYFGRSGKLWGNGIEDKQSEPIFMYDGTLFTPYGYGGNQFPYKETNWSPRYKEMSFTAYVPLEMYMKGADREILGVTKIQVGIQEINAEFNENGQLLSITVARKDSSKTYKAPFKSVGPVTLLLDSRFDGADDYQTVLDTTRRLPGHVTGSQTADLDNGYTISYPEAVNGKTVTLISQGNNEYSFNIEDTPYDPDVASMYCREHASQQIGPQIGQPVAIAPESRSKLIDWGVTKEHYSDVFSFTGPGYHCQLRATQAFRLDMFKIAF